MKMLSILWMLLAILPCSAQKVEWQNWEIGTDLMEKNNRHGIVLLRATNCHLAKKLIKETIHSPEVSHWIRTQFIPIEIIHGSTNLEFDYGIKRLLQHKKSKPEVLQKMIEKETIERPILFILDKNGKALQAFSGFLQKEKLARILQYFGEGHHITTPWKKFAEQN